MIQGILQAIAYEITKSDNGTDIWFEQAIHGNLAVWRTVLLGTVGGCCQYSRAMLVTGYERAATNCSGD